MMRKFGRLASSVILWTGEEAESIVQKRPDLTVSSAKFRDLGDA